MPEPTGPIPFEDVVRIAEVPLDDGALAALVRADALECGRRFQMVPTIARYAGVIDPSGTPEAALEVAHQVVHAAGPDREHVVHVLSRTRPPWADVLRRSSVALELLGTADDALVLPEGVGAPQSGGGPRFAVGEAIARGGFGVITEAIDRAVPDPRSPEAEVVIKFLRSTSSDAPWRAEARTAASIDHPCGIAVRAQGDLGAGTGFVAFERVRGRSLASLAAAERPMSPGQAIAAVGELCDAIAELHDAGLAHGDITPSNVMVDPFGRLRLVDYGLSRTINPGLEAIDVAQVGALLQWLMLGFVPTDGSGVEGRGARRMLVRLGQWARSRPVRADALAARLLEAEWARERRKSWAIAVLVVVVFAAGVSGLRAALS